MRKKSKENILPDLTEFIDEDGKRWIQTSTEDLFSSKEFADIMESVESNRETGDIILARIDFQRVDKEYHERVIELQEKLKKQNKLLKKLLIDAKKTLDRKNRKLKELIDYIKKLHLLLAYYKLSPENIEKMGILPDLLLDSKRIEEEVEEKKIEYAEVEEFLLNEKGEETERAKF